MSPRSLHWLSAQAPAPITELALTAGLDLSTMRREWLLFADP
jgi:hypothetical protein